MERLTLFHLRQPTREFDLDTPTIFDQTETEKLVKKAYFEKLRSWKDEASRLFKINHINYLNKRLADLPSSFECLDASQPWLAYWIVHSLRLLDFNIPERTKLSIVQFIRSTQHPDGGFGGGPYQFSHLATSYGAVNCLALLCRQDALDVINRDKLFEWLCKLHQPDGSFLLHIGGEADVRGVYCAVAIARLTRIINKYPELSKNTAEWIASCQTYEGGYGGQPGTEAHGGYTFCAVAALCLLGRTDLIDLPRLLRWVAHRQMPSEGGFQGRTNKLVDSCYSFWQGALFPIIEELLYMSGDPALSPNDTLLNPLALQEYIIFCCQKVSYTHPGLSVSTHRHQYQKSDPSSGTMDNSECNMCVTNGGGLVDKPGKNADVYHTCYALSGLSVAQHAPRLRYNSQSASNLPNDLGLVSLGQPCPTPAADILGSELGNELADVDPLHNILHDALSFTLTYFTRIDEGHNAQSAEQEARTAAERCSLPSVMDLNSRSMHSTVQETESQHMIRETEHTCTTP